MQRAWKTMLLAALLGYAASSTADTLINKKNGQIVDVGTAKIDKTVIHWTSCRPHTSTRDYAVQDYAVAVGDNCNIGQPLPKTGSSVPLIGALGLALFTIGVLMSTCRKLYHLMAGGPGENS
jgi:LPXTG-motif cell wall-anchored protein